MFGDTEIFAFILPNVGQRYADPLAIRRRLLTASEGRLFEWVQAARSYQKLLTELGDKEGPEADSQRADWSFRQAELEGWLAEAAFASFEGFAPVDPATGSGVTEVVALEVLNAYIEWIEQKKRTPEPLPT
jgi:hypothetical protein